MLRFLVTPLLLLLTLPILAAAVPTAERLRTEFLDNPLGIDTTPPQVSWQFLERGRGARQTLYQVQVAASAAAPAAGKTELWDSGKVRSAETANIPPSRTCSVTCAKRPPRWTPSTAPSPAAGSARHGRLPCR